MLANLKSINKGIKDIYESDVLINNNNIMIDKSKNRMSLFIPSDSPAADAEYILTCTSSIKNYINTKDVIIYNTQGTWYSKEHKTIVNGNIITLEIAVSKITNKYINFMLNLGLQVKKEIKGETLSVIMNNKLCLV